MGAMSERAWEDASAKSYTAAKTMVGDLEVIVCLDDEGPITPAFYWEIHNSFGMLLNDGWANTTDLARSDAVEAAERMQA